MDEIEYKLNTNNSVLVVNAIEKLISTIKSKYKPGERQKFVLDNEELKFLRGKCLSKEPVVSLAACQGLLALVEQGVLEIGHTMSTVVTLLPSTHNYSAITSTISGLLILDLKSRLVPGQPYRCPFSLQSPQHPLITVLEHCKDAEDDVLIQMQALCTNPNYIVSSNSLELLRPVFLWLTCHPSRAGDARAWRMLLALAPSTAQAGMLLTCLSCQQIRKRSMFSSCVAAYTTVMEAALSTPQPELVTALLPMLARISNEIVKCGGDPRAVYALITRGLSLSARRAAGGALLALLAENLPYSPAAYLQELFDLGLTIINKCEYPSTSLSTFVALSLQWLYLPSYLTTYALKSASKILDIYQNTSHDTTAYTSHLKANKTFYTLLQTDIHLSIVFRLYQTWEKIQNEPERIKTWLEDIDKIDGKLKLELAPFLIGLFMDNRREVWYDNVKLLILNILVGLVNEIKEEKDDRVSVMLLPILIYKISNDAAPNVKMECLKALPLMAKVKGNVPVIVAVLNKLKASREVPWSFLISLYTTLAETQIRCFPYLQEVLVDQPAHRPNDLKWETDIARANAVCRMCELRPSRGLELVSLVSATLNRCTDSAGAPATCLALKALLHLWRGAAVAPPSAWLTLEPKLGRDARPLVQISICSLLSSVPSLRVSTPEYVEFTAGAARRLWTYVADSEHSEVIEAACDALSNYRIEDYELKHIPEIYRRTVKLPSSYCKTPEDAARNPEDVLDYVPCEVWPELYKSTLPSALSGVERLCARLLEREVRAYRAGVYSVEGGEPASYSYLPVTSVARGLMECYRKQITNPSYEFSAAALQSILATLSRVYPRALPPLGAGWLAAAAGAAGAEARRGVIGLAAGLSHSKAARTMLEGWLVEAEEEEDVLQMFSLLPALCRSVPASIARPTLDKCLQVAYRNVGQNKKPEECLFIKLLDYIRQALECTKLHDTYRDMLAAILEYYFNIVSEDHISWPALSRALRILPSASRARMRDRAGSARRRAGLRGGPPEPGDVLYAAANNEQDFITKCLLPSVANVRGDAALTWFRQLTETTTVAFNESSDEAQKLYLCTVVMSSTLTISQLDRVCDSECFPTAAGWVASEMGLPEMMEWLCHTRDIIKDGGISVSCQRAFLAARHLQKFAEIWTNIESQSVKHLVSVEF